MDKRFVVAYALGRASDQPPILTGHGHEFPGLEPSEPHLVYLKTREPAGTSMGARVEQLLAWSFDRQHNLSRADGPPRFS